nr:MAG TPA: hypothetical protein [Bacteriophage sp.]
MQLLLMYFVCFCIFPFSHLFSIHHFDDSFIYRF